MKRLSQGCTVKFKYEHSIFYGMVLETGLANYAGGFKNIQEHTYTVKTEDGEKYRVKLSNILEVEEKGQWLPYWY